MSSADEAELLGAIVAHPDDDIARLVYADWLSEQGDPRGELIALQVQQTKQYEGTAAWARIQRRVDLLLFQHWERWEPKVRVELEPPRHQAVAGPADHSTSWTFLRGFPERLRTVPQLMTGYAAEVRAAAPLLWDVRLDCQRMPRLDPTGWVEALARQLLGVRQLGLSHVAESSLIVLAGRPELSALEGLLLDRCQLGAAGPDALAHGRSTLLGLKRLELSRVALTEAAGARLFKGRFEQLRELAIHHEQLKQRTCVALGAIASGVQKLDLSWCTLADESMEKVLFGPLTQQLVEINLSYLTAGEPVGQWLRAPPKTLKAVRLTQARLAGSTVRSLLESDPLQQLELLDLAGVTLGDSESAALLARFGDRVLFRTEE